MSLNAVSEDIRQLLDDNSAALGLASIPITSFQWKSETNGDEVDSQVLVLDTDAIDALIKDEYENPVFNVRVRGDTQEGVKSVHDRARGIYEFLLQEVRTIINGTEYVEYAPLGGLLPEGKDKSNRFIYTMNFFTYRDPI